MSRDWCRLFADMEVDPSAIITPRLTVREFYEAKTHTLLCDICYNRVLRVDALNKPKNSKTFNVNLN